MATAVKKNRKIFVLDTNVLLHDFKSIHNFDEHDIIVPITVLEELDKFKKDTLQGMKDKRKDIMVILL